VILFVDPQGLHRDPLMVAGFAGLEYVPAFVGEGRESAGRGIDLYHAVARALDRRRRGGEHAPASGYADADQPEVVIKGRHGLEARLAAGGCDVRCRRGTDRSPDAKCSKQSDAE
jgi:hypothetical protein